MSIGANTLEIGCFNSWNFPKECQAVLQKIQVSGFTCGWTIFPHTTCQALRIFKLKTSPCRWLVFFANNQCHKLTQWQQMSLSRMVVSRSGPVRTYWRPPQTGRWGRTSSAWKLVIWELDILESFFSKCRDTEGYMWMLMLLPRGHLDQSSLGDFSLKCLFSVTPF